MAVKKDFRGKLYKIYSEPGLCGRRRKLAGWMYINAHGHNFVSHKLDRFAAIQEINRKRRERAEAILKGEV